MEGEGGRGCGAPPLIAAEFINPVPSQGEDPSPRQARREEWHPPLSALPFRGRPVRAGGVPTSRPAPWAAAGSGLLPGGAGPGPGARGPGSVAGSGLVIARARPAPAPAPRGDPWRGPGGGRERQGERVTEGGRRAGP